jgi:hypothetical protein
MFFRHDSTNSSWSFSADLCSPAAESMSAAIPKQIWASFSEASISNFFWTFSASNFNSLALTLGRFEGSLSRECSFCAYTFRFINMLNARCEILCEILPDRCDCGWVRRRPHRVSDLTVGGYRKFRRCARLHFESFDALLQLAAKYEIFPNANPIVPPQS